MSLEFAPDGADSAILRCMAILHSPVLLAAGVLALADALSAQAAPGSEAPAIEFDAVLNADGATTLADFRGSLVLLEFWASWCGPCRAVLPHLKRLHEQFADRGLVVLGCNFGEKGAVAEAFVRQEAIEYPIGLDATRKAGNAYGVRGIPHAFLIDPQGVVVWAGHPARLKDDQIEQALVGARAFAGKLQEQLAPVQMLLDQDRKGRALTMLETLLQHGKLEKDAQQTARQAATRLQRDADGLFARGMAQKTTARVAAALVWQQLADRFEGHDTRLRAIAQLDELGKSSEGSCAIGLATQLLRAADAVRRSDFDAAQQDYEAVAAAGDAEAAALAHHELTLLAARRAAAAIPARK